MDINNSADKQLLLIHPIGVGLSARFWDRFVACWQTTETPAVLLAPDLLGCVGNRLILSIVYDQMRVVSLSCPVVYNYSVILIVWDEL